MSSTDSAMLCTSQDLQVERRGRAVTARLGGGPQFLRPVAPVIASSSRWPTVRNQGNAPARASGTSSPPIRARRRSSWGRGCDGRFPLVQSRTWSARHVSFPAQLSLVRVIYAESGANHLRALRAQTLTLRDDLQRLP